MSHRVLITGATGFIGGNLLAECLSNNWEVSAFVMENDPEENRIANKGVKIIPGDLRNEASVRNAVKDIDIIFHCAGLVTDWAPKSLFREVILDGTENICKAAHAEHISRLIYVSTNDVFGRIEDEVIDEFYPLKKWNEPYPDYKIEAEKVVWYYFNEHGLPASIVYPCWVYGPGDRTFVPLLADAIINGEMLFWRKNVHVWPTYIDNLVDIMMLLAKDESSVGNGYLVHDGEKTTLQEFCTKIAKSINYKEAKLQIPYALAYLVALLLEGIWSIFKLKNRPLLTTYAVKNLGSRFNYSIDRAKSELGWTPKIPHKVGMKRTLQWLNTIDQKDLKQK